MTYGVFIESWQQQCCGKATAVGSAVAWTVNWRADRYSTLDRVLSTEAAAQIEFLEDHHGEDDVTDGTLRGTVTRLEALTAESVIRDRRLHHIDRTGHLRAVTALDPWELEPGPDDSWSFLGWIAHVDGIYEGRTSAAHGAG